MTNAGKWNGGGLIERGGQRAFWTGTSAAVAYTKPAHRFLYPACILRGRHHQNKGRPSLLLSDGFRGIPDLEAGA